MSRKKIEQYFNLLVNKFVKLDNRSSLKYPIYRIVQAKPIRFGDRSVRTMEVEKLYI
jgi:hypothetical protein